MTKHNLSIETKINKLEADRFVPSTTTERLIFEPIAGVVYISEGNNGCFSAIGFSGRRLKDDFYYNFLTREKMDKHIATWVQRLESWKKSQDERRLARKNATHSLIVGDVLVSSWGYEQTNIDFFEVVSVDSPKTIKIRAIAGSKSSEEGGSMYGTVLPIKGRYLNDEVMTKRADDNNRVTVDYVRSAGKWGGKPEHWTAWY